MWFKKYWDLFLLLFARFPEIPDKEYASMPTLFHYDEYDNCLSSSDDSLYCAITFQLYPIHPENTSAVWKVIEKTTLSERYYRHDQLRHGVCVKKTCPDVEVLDFFENNDRFISNLQKCYNNKYEEMGIRGEIARLRCEESKWTYPISYFDIAFAVFTVTFTMLVILAWIYDILFTPNFKETNFKKTKFGKFISSFSLTQNWHRLNDIDLTNPDIRLLRCMQGIRFFCMFNVIGAHCTVVNLAIPVLSTRYVEEIPERFLDRWISSGSRHAILQTFFMMSSWLLTYQFFKDNEGKDKVEFSYLLRSFVKRYFRITPTLAIVTGLCSTWLIHFERGPFWEDIIGEVYKNCRSNGWANIAYLNIYLPQTSMCLPSLWYMAVDTQYYVLGLFLLWLIWNYQNKIVLILSSVWIVHIVDSYFKASEQNIVLPFYPEIFYNMNFLNIDHAGTIAKAPTANMSGLIAGIGFGYTYYKCRNRILFTKKLHVILWWFASLGISILIVPFPALSEKITLTSESREFYYILYGTLSRSVYVFGTGFFIFGMTQGHGHIIKSINEWPPMYVLGRITYSAYLVHAVIQLQKVGMKRTPNYLNDYILNWEVFGDLTLSYLSALWFTLFFELPIGELRKHIVSSIKNRKQNVCNKKEE